jgi:hypothetical protein
MPNYLGVEPLDDMSLVDPDFMSDALSLYRRDTE